MFGAQENRMVWDVPASATLLQCRGSLGEDGAILACLDPRRTMPKDSCREGGEAWVPAFGRATGARQEVGQGWGRGGTWRGAGDRGGAGPGSRRGGVRAGQEAGSCPLQQNH